MTSPSFLLQSIPISSHALTPTLAQTDEKQKDIDTFQRAKACHYSSRLQLQINAWKYRKVLFMLWESFHQAQHTDARKRTAKYCTCHEGDSAKSKTPIRGKRTVKYGGRKQKSIVNYSGHRQNSAIRESASRTASWILLVYSKVFFPYRWLFGSFWDTT